MEHIPSENLKKLAIAYNRRNMYALVFCRFELKQGEIRTYPTAKNALVFPIEGKATFQLDQTSYYMKRGKFLHACPGKLLTISNQDNRSFRYIVIYYEGSAQSVFEEEVKNSHVLISKLENILSYNGSTLLADSYWQEVLIEQFFELLFKDIYPGYISTDGDLIKTSLEYIHKNYREKITLSMLAEQVGASAPHLSYLFEKVLNIRPIDYLIDYRIKQAIELLQRPGANSVSQIAKQVGYSDAYYFSRVFKKRTGFAPSVIKNRE
ncbi:helix-turn-helix transcriptional regulator [Mediterraneibacter massiliensis]|jgi:AraC-like DNA-binding protein|uniref:helix-turn-helix transcriptional regulator n=1 Tax=Mediterraneibacter massiliensis TaxID=1720300 RepID=UPI0024ACF020|nr:AraC family transcriptional regulator [Mediterraneibacter massiliensis]